MATGSQRSRGDTLELAHHYVGGDGEAALQALLSGFEEQNQSLTVRETQYDDLRLQVKNRILGQDPPEVWSGWPGGEIQGYEDVGVVLDVTDTWESSGMVDGYRDVVADAARVDGRYYAVPLTVHRINDLYVHTEVAADLGVDPGRASGPTELVEMLEAAATSGDQRGILLPMADPFPTLQLWEVIVLGLADHQTFRAITGGEAARHRDTVVAALELVDRIADMAGGDSVYEGLTDANEQFREGVAPVYPQGDWAGGVFVEADDFTFEREWDRVPFPGTENMYAVVIDTLIPSASADLETISPFLEYAGSPDAQERFARKKGSIPARGDVSATGFDDFVRSQLDQFDRATDHPQTITHGLSVAPDQLVDLKTTVAEFLDTRDASTAADEMVRILDR